MICKSAIAVFCRALVYLYKGCTSAGRTLVKMDFKKRLKMELEPFIMFVSIMCGLPMFMIPKDVFQKVVPRTFGSWSMAWNTIR